MKMTMIHSNCKNMEICPPFLHLQGAPTSLLNSLSFTKLIQYHRFQKTSRSTKTAPITLSTFRRTLARCSLDDELPGLTTEVAEVHPSLVVKSKAAEIISELKGTSIFLVGLNSTMKANLGEVLADALRYYYFDSDSLVKQVIGGESDIKSFHESNEKLFHDSETEVLKQLSSMGRLVVCTGDGAVQSSTNLALLRHGISIWIDVPLDMLAREVMESASQCHPAYPMPNSNSSEVLSKLTELYKGMREGYGTADATVPLQKVACQLGYDSIDRVTVEDMALQTLKEIEKLTRVKKMMEAAARPF